MRRNFQRRSGTALLVVSVLGVLLSGCSRGGNKKSPTTPQGGIWATGTWNITYIVTATTCDYGGQPGATDNMTITLLQEGAQLTSPEYPGSTGSINTTTGQFTITQQALAFEITLAGVTDGTSAGGLYTLKSVRLDSGAACEIIYDFTGVKISADTKSAVHR